MAQFVHVVPRDRDAAAARLELAADQPEDGGLATAATSHDGDHLAAREPHADTLQDGTDVVIEFDVLNFDEGVGGHRE